MESTIEYYNKIASEYANETLSVDFTQMQDDFLKYLPESGRILDFGCGSGRDTKYFLSKGYMVDAIDGSEKMCQIACQNTGILVKNMLFEELNAVEEYNGIWACASILHLTKKELPAILQKLSDAVKTEGIIYISFKYGEFEGEKNGRYFTYLTEAGLKGILKDVTELNVEKLWITKDVRKERGDEAWLNVILRKQ